MLVLYDAIQINNLAGLIGDFNAGFFRLATGSQPPVNGAFTGATVAQLRFQNPAFQTPSASGNLAIAQAFPLTPDSNAVGGTIGYFICFGLFGNPLCTGTVGQTGADFNMPQLTYPAGAIVQVNSFTIAMPEI